MSGASIVIGLLLLGGAAAWTVDIESDISVHMNRVLAVPFSVYNYNGNDINSKLSVATADSDIATSSLHPLASNGSSFNGVLNITGVFLGRTRLIFNLQLENGVSIYIYTYI